MKFKKNALIITSHYPPNFGGVESHLQALVTSLNKKDWGVYVSTYQPLASGIKAPFSEKKRGLVIYRFPWIGFNLVHLLTNYPILEFIYLFPGLLLISLITILRHKDNINVIHSQGLVPAVVGILLKKITGKRLIASTHNLYFFPQTGLYKIFSRIIFSQADKVLTPTYFAREELMRIGVPGDKIKRFRYWIDLKHFRPVDERQIEKQLDFIKELSVKKKVFFVGRLIETKGIKLLLAAFKKVDSSIHLVIAGDGPLKDLVERTAKESDNVVFLGRVESEKLPLYYTTCDVLVVPSLVDEGFGFVVMEAVACGMPVLASNRGGLSEAVNEKIGKLIDLNIKSWASEINNFFNRESEVKVAGNLRAYAVKNFSDKNILDITSAYEQD